MEHMSSMMEEKLKRRIRDLEEEQEVFLEKTRKLDKEEEMEDDALRRAYQEADYMRETCKSEDREILSLLDEKQGVLNLLKKRKTEFEEELKAEIQKKQRHWEMEEEDIYSQLSVLQQQENEKR